MRKLMQRKLFLALIVSSTTLTNCGQASSTNSASAISDSSTSGAAAGAVGGALTNSGANGTQARMSYMLPTTLVASVRQALSPLPQASAANQFCPTFKDTGSSCSTSGSSMWLNYSDCTFTGRAEWNGVQQITMSSANTAACGAFPNPGASSTLYRQFVQSVGGSVAGQVTITADGVEGTVDDATANLGNFNLDPIAATNPNGAYGAAVSFNASDARSSLNIAHHLTIAGVLDHSVTGTLAITEVPGADSRLINGSVKVYHNLLRVIGTSTFAQVTHKDICCLPVGGVITTQFTAGTVAPTVAGEKYVGKSEVLTFTGCGTATLQAVDGTVSNVTLNRCF
jgi:hypothetical protein